MSTNDGTPLDLTRTPPVDLTRIVARASAAAFNRPLVTNVLRAMLVEAMIAETLEPAWRWCAADYANWDFENSDGLKLEVKQSAARQSWAPPDSKSSRIQFDIAPRRYHWAVDTGWVPAGNRVADIYVLAHNPVTDERADHRDPRQWLFHVVATRCLPPTRTILLPAVERLARPVLFEALAREVAEVAATIRGEATA